MFLFCFQFFLGYPAVSGAADDTLNSGKGHLFDFPFFNVPIGSTPDSGAVEENKGKGEARDGKKREKEIRDKKVDDAIKKAWEEK